jgi:4-amino-4-deoxy-L-arabinose transferase-like glycosyltransferase
MAGFAMISKLKLSGGAVGAIVFLLLGLCFVDRAGIATDEAALEATLFRSWRFFSVPVFHHNVPVMELTYIGELKTWLYAPIFVIFNPTAAAIRVPAILMGALTVLMFGVLLERVHSRRAAWVGSIFLATDTSFLLTTVHDWGPVVLQHLLLGATMLLAVRWFQTASNAALAGAAFCCGLAVWDKAVFIWILSGLAAGCLLFAGEIRMRLTFRRAITAAIALCLGALPLIVYNLTGPEKFATVRSNMHKANGLSSIWFVYNLRQLEAAWDGSALFGYLVSEDAGPRPGSPHSLLERASFVVHSLAGEHRENRMTLASCGAVLLFPLLWRTRARKLMLFSAIAIVVAWLHMDLAGGGGAAHHAVLLWPLPHFFIAVALAEASLQVRFGKWALVAIVGLLAIGDLLVTNQYLYGFVRNGPTETWTNAVYPLASDLKQAHASQVLLPDWGVTDSLCVLNRDNPPVHPAEEPFVVSDTNAIWVDHTPGREFSKGVDERVLAAARSEGFEPVMMQTYYDRNGRAMFQSFKFRKNRGAEKPENR